MSIIAWIMLGIVAGVVANQLSGKRGVGLVSDALLGTAGAAIAGFAFNGIAGTKEGALSLWSLLVALLGAGVFLGVSAAIVGTPRVTAPSRAQRHRRIRR